MIPMIDQEGFARTGREIRLTAPLDEATVRSLKVGDVVLVSGRMYTGRDAVHAHLMKHEPPVDLKGSVLYHCGPVVKKEGDGWKVTAAGPTTSIREEPYQAEILRRYGVRAVIGKGGMGAKTLQGLKESGAVYLNAVGGAAQFYARCIERTDDVSLMEFGTPEAMWHLWVRDFPAIVTMDAHGNSLHKDLEAESGKKALRRWLQHVAAFAARSVEIEQLRPPISPVHRALVEIHGREILNRQQRKRRRFADVDHFRVAAALPAQLDAALAAGSHPARPRRNRRRCFRNTRSGAMCSDQPRAQYEQRSVCAPSCASMNAGHDPQNGQYPRSQSNKGRTPRPVRVADSRSHRR